MIDFILSFVTGGGIGTALSAAIAGLAALVGVFLTGRKQGKQKAQNDAMKDTLKKQKDGRDAVVKERAKTEGLSGGDVVDRMRGRDWS